MIKLVTVYVDTSVFGGAYDEEFAVPSRAFFEEVRSGRVGVCVSAIVLEELRGEPQEVQALYADLAHRIALVEVSQ